LDEVPVEPKAVVRDVGSVEEVVVAEAVEFVIAVVGLVSVDEAGRPKTEKSRRKEARARNLVAHLWNQEFLLQSQMLQF
jgi:hypothetical protein